MGRGTPTYESGTIPAAGAGVQQAVVDLLVAKIAAYQSNGETAWELADNISQAPATLELVWHSVGDRSLGSGANKGDTDIWIRLERPGGGGVGAMRWSVLQDYSPTSHTGLREVPGLGGWVTFNDTGEVNWYMVINEYGIAFVVRQGGAYVLLQLGQLIRTPSAALNGVTRITSQSGTGNGVVFGLDRDISSRITEGQYVWLVNQTPDGQALQSVGIDLCDVVAVSWNSITLDGVTRTYANSSLCGLEPQPVICQLGAGSSVYLPHGMDGTSGIAGAGVGELDHPLDFIEDTENDPMPDGTYPVDQPYVRGGSPQRGLRGKCEHLRVTVDSALLDLDVIELDGIATQRWLLFTTAIVGGWYTLIGPGAS